MAQGRRWLEQLLGRPSSDQARVKGLSGLAGLAYWQGDYPTAQKSYEVALELYRKLGDRLGEAHTLFGLSTSLIWLGDSATGRRLVDEARDIYEELGERGEVRNILMALGFARWREGDLTGGQTPVGRVDADRPRTWGRSRSGHQSTGTGVPFLSSR